MTDINTWRRRNRRNDRIQTVLFIALFILIVVVAIGGLIWEFNAYRDCVAHGGLFFTGGNTWPQCYGAKR
jgi:hypothetical protein